MITSFISSSREPKLQFFLNFSSPLNLLTHVLNLVSPSFIFSHSSHNSIKIFDPFNFKPSSALGNISIK